MLYPRNDLRSGRLRLPVTTRPLQTTLHGIRNIGLDKDRDALLYIPQTYSPEQGAPFALLLHGAGGSAEHGLFLLKDLAEIHNLILLAPSSRGNTWDLIEEGMFDRDVLFIQQALETVFQTCVPDKKRFAIGGFSDGASYALSLGLINGELFTHILAFSPGFFRAPTAAGKPRLYLSHGINDNVLPIGLCSRRLVPKLQRDGYDVTYREFNGGHTIPGTVSTEAINWFL